ncbi:MAG: hypothetical protein HKN43_06840 [Rhodothermales bacterium]|nr:hypothetical protein [Rhodothermales bacterium]
MSRTLIVLFIAAVLAGVAAAFIWYFSVRLDPSIPKTAAVTSLEGATRVDWYPLGVEVHFTGSDLDAYRGLGFAHAIDTPWLISLLRQAALGELGSWFDVDLAAMDSLVHLLDIPESAQQGEALLNARASAVLQAYADGVNAGFESGLVYRDESFLAINVVPEAWLPWHSLAIEKLIAWIAAAESLPEDPATSDIIGHTQQLSGFLGIGGFSNSVIWGVRNPDSTVTGIRYNTGSSQIPLLLPARLVSGNDAAVEMLTIAGTPYSVFTKTDAGAFAILPNSSASVLESPVDAAAIDTTFDRIRRFDGSESLVTQRRIENDLVLDCQPDANTVSLELSIEQLPNVMQSCSRLSWPGLDVTSDANEWTDLDSPGQFGLWTGSNASILEDETTIRPESSWIPAGFGNRVTVSTQSQWRPFLISRLVAISSSTSWSAEILKSDARSSWAAQMGPALEQALIKNDTTDVDVSSALTYLRNWDYEYSPASIAASILETWSANTVDLDTAYTADPSSMATTREVRKSLDTLRERFGADMSEWRWEAVNRQYLEYPAWSYLRRLPEDLTGRYSLIIRRKTDRVASAGGHPSTFKWSASPVSGPQSFQQDFVVSVSSNDLSKISYTGHMSARRAQAGETGPVIDASTKSFGSARLIFRSTLQPGE